MGLQCHCNTNTDTPKTNWSSGKLLQVGVGGEGGSISHLASYIMQHPRLPDGWSGSAQDLSHVHPLVPHFLNFIIHFQRCMFAGSAPTSPLVPVMVTPISIGKTQPDAPMCGVCGFHSHKERCDDILPSELDTKKMWYFSVQIKTCIFMQTSQSESSCTVPVISSV